MICTGKEWDSCQVEKLGCNGCFYNSLSNEEVEQFIKEIKNVKTEGLNELDDYTLKLFKAIVQIIDERDELRIQRDYYKKMYAEFNNAFVQGGRKLTED